MPSRLKKRALILTGAGASIDFGAPSTTCLTNSVERKILADGWMQRCGGDQAWSEIRETLSRYFSDGADGLLSPNAVNFEHIYHCAHELLSTFEPSKGAAREFLPVLVPFIERRTALDAEALRQLVTRIAAFIFAEISAVCEHGSDLSLLTTFLETLRRDHTVRIYTTSYDNFLLRAAPDLHTGFDSRRHPGAKPFDGKAFWSTFQRDSAFHLHGSVHLSFGFPHAPDADLGSLYWYDDPAVALQNSNHTGSDERRMDGGGTVRTVIITGLDKLSSLQRQPFSHYYASMARDAMEADIIFVIGSGLGDLHLNTWLGQARRRDPPPPLVFVDYWSDSFRSATAFGLDRKEIEMVHELRMPFTDHGLVDYGTGWCLDKRRTCAIWDKGFRAFLTASDELDHVLEELR